MGFLRRLVGHPSSAPDAPVPSLASNVERHTSDGPPPFPDSRACPTCGTVLDPLPKSSRKCPACRTDIIVRHQHGATALFTAETLAAYEAARETWGRIYQRRKETEAAARFVDEAGYNAIEAELAAKGPGYTDRDVYWTAANRGTLRMVEQGDWGWLSAAYSEMALTAYNEEDEDDSSERVLTLQRECATAELRAFLAAGCTRVDIIACGCPVCSRGPKLRLLIRDQLASSQLPHPGCRQGWCSCNFVPVVE
jgi:hypothetical protein